MMRSRGSRAGEPVDFSDLKATRRWFEQQPYEVAVAMAARAALRVLPLIATGRAVEPRARFFNTVALPCFRAAAATWAIARFPTERDKLLTSVGIAANDAYAAATNVRSLELVYRVRGARISSATDAAGAIADAAAAAVVDPITDSYSAGHAVGADPEAAATDAELIYRGETQEERAALAGKLSLQPLWPDDAPSEIREAWVQLRAMLLARDEDWAVWTDWYEACVAGLPADPDLEVKRVTLPEDAWDEGAKAVNAAIRRLIEEARAPAIDPSEPIPPQGAGPHFTLGASNLIALALPSEIDASGNNLGRIRQLLPLVRRAADDLSGHLNPNVFRELARDVGDYRAAIVDENSIAWGTLFGLGVMIENAASAAERHLDAPMWPRLEDTAKAALDSLLTLHGPLILATAEGRELADEADRTRLTREEQMALRTDAQALSKALKEDRDITESAAAELVEKAVEPIGEGPHPERGTVFGVATVKNVTIVLVSAGGLATLIPAGAMVAGTVGGFAAAGAAWVGYEALKRTKVFGETTKVLGGEFDRLHESSDQRFAERLRRLAPFRDFVIKNEKPLRRIASNTTKMRWMLGYLDFIVGLTAMAVKGHRHRLEGYSTTILGPARRAGVSPDTFSHTRAAMSRKVWV